ncbi:UDP-N-acetyl glucosamine 2-epimerase [Prevotella sp. A2931]|uniref:UDP-N-acetyl glucosamine 2-epimerase n=1 Tax=Prevotella illustrans TaxID=2800387 RepID=A0ABS3M6W5_9BACT|nr:MULTISPECIES: UDP-N-acetyl glucosamine 2-epimerase [Prevotella]MBO1363909.1 UDP-N-acetyl glucosamine 2-epimerase [Prevotella illustrans]PTL25432.1 UDP-N-acetylglucosamine 2-epimerase (non-hydrolyzing) [Prevotella sp. oral taxon 820]
MKKICIFCGARPNFMKVAPLIRSIKNYSNEGHDIAYSLVYAGAENDPTLENSLFTDLQIDRPDTFLNVVCENLNELTGQVMSKFEYYLQTNPTQMVVVVDDLASTMAAAIVTKKQGIILAHIAAGTRSFDINMPKEINRLVIDGLSDILFTAGFSNNNIANKAGTELSKVFMVGNILIDNLRFNHQRIAAQQLPADVNMLIAASDNKKQPLPYLIFTLNRKALIADKNNLRQMIGAIDRVVKEFGVPVLAPLRNDALQTVQSMLDQKSAIHLIEPQSYLAFSKLTAQAAGIITDSGNVAEEASFNGVPCITLNSYTEHIETVTVGSNILVGENADSLAQSLHDMLAGQWKKCGIPDRWDGRSGERILHILIESLE